MRIRFRYLVAAAAVAALFGAPTATADSSCTNTANGSVCSTPGNVQINDSPSAADFTLPYWDEVWGGAYPGPYPVPYAEGS